MAKKRKSRTPQPSVEQPAPADEPINEPELEQTAIDDAIDENAQNPEQNTENYEQEAEDNQQDNEEEEEEEEEEVEEEEEEDEDEENDQETTGNEVIKTEEETENLDLDDEPVEKLLEPFSKEQLVLLLKEAVTKHPEFIESVQAIADADPAHRKIFAYGLGWDTTTEVLLSEYGKYGEIEDCKHVVDKVSGKSKGYAFILFKHRAGAQKALKEPQKKIGSRVSSCQLASAGPGPGNAQSSAANANAPVVSEYTQRKIFVSNVAADIDPNKLLEFFSKFGEIEDGPLGLDKQTGKPRGFALFVYKSVESAKKALEEPHKVFEGHTLHCQKAVDGPKPNKPFFQQPHQQHNQYGGGGGHHHPSKKSKYSNSGGGGGYGPGHGHLMAPAGPSMGYNPAVSPALTPVLGQALTALLSSQGGGLGNLLGLGGAPQGMPPAGYGAQPGMQGGYPNPQAGQGGNRPQQGGAPYMGHDSTMFLFWTPLNLLKFRQVMQKKSLLYVAKSKLCLKSRFVNPYFFFYL
ncbi:putative RNA recognition motif domain, nucleotide-binding alpha-beta plait domain superfamily [Helianthus annuus]|nr:putative RNA recognition motif domain, nucleotide-binding alpha-beta plait domain superfamily [Helianthus annuus]